MTREQLAAIARRYDTVMSRAMLRALGIEPPTPRADVGRVPKRNRYKGARKLMHQRHGVNLWR